MNARTFVRLRALALGYRRAKHGRGGADKPAVRGRGGVFGVPDGPVFHCSAPRSLVTAPREAQRLTVLSGGLGGVDKALQLLVRLAVNVIRDKLVFRGLR